MILLLTKGTKRQIFPAENGMLQLALPSMERGTLVQGFTHPQRNTATGGSMTLLLTNGPGRLTSMQIPALQPLALVLATEDMWGADQQKIQK